MADGARIDKWLWHARFYRTRILAKDAANAGIVRINGRRVDKCSTLVAPGDVLTLPRGRDVTVVRVLALASRRGQLAEARLLYQILSETAA